MSALLNESEKSAMHAQLVKALGVWQIYYWCKQLACTEDQLLTAVLVVGLSAEDIDQYLHHMQ